MFLKVLCSVCNLTGSLLTFTEDLDTNIHRVYVYSLASFLIPQKQSPSRHSETSSPPIVSLHGQSNSITAGTIPKPLGLRIPNLHGTSSSMPHIPLFHTQRPAFFPWLYSQHTPPPSPLMGERSYGSTNQPISSSTNLPNGDMTNIVNIEKLLCIK